VVNLNNGDILLTLTGVNLVSFHQHVDDTVGVHAESLCQTAASGSGAGSDVSEDKAEWGEDGVDHIDLGSRQRGEDSAGEVKLGSEEHAEEWGKELGNDDGSENSKEEGEELGDLAEVKSSAIFLGSLVLITGGSGILLGSISICGSSISIGRSSVLGSRSSVSWARGSLVVGH